jgi:hypothetical protein
VIRDLAAEPQPGPWHYDDTYDHVATEGGSWITNPGGCDYDDARWIAAFSPAIAEPLATWLGEAASTVELLARWGDEVIPQIYGTALAFARSILSSVPKET